MKGKRSFNIFERVGRFLTVLTFLCVAFLSHSLASTLVTVVSGIEDVGPNTVEGKHKYNEHWQYWSQGASGYLNSSDESKLRNMPRFGCRVVAQTKLLVEAGLASSNVNIFNPDVYFAWTVEEGHQRKSPYENVNGAAIPAWARSKGVEVVCTIEKYTSVSQVMNHVNNGEYVIMSCDNHQAYIGRDASIKHGSPVVLDSSGLHSYSPKLTVELSGYTGASFNTLYIYTIVGKTLNISTSGFGRITGATNGDIIRSGTNVSLQAEPDTGFAFSKWTMSGIPNQTESSEKTLVFTMPDNDVSVNAVFVHNPAQTAWGWSNLKVDSVTQTDAVVSASFYYGLPVGTINYNAAPTFYLFSGPNESSVLSAKPDNYSGAHMLNLGKLNGTAGDTMFDRNYSLKANSLASNYCWLTAGQTFYYKWVAVHNNKTMESPVAIGQAKGQSAIWSKLHTNDPSYGLFNAQVNWDKNLTMNEVGCFVSTDRSKVEGAKRNNANGCAVKKDVGGIAKVSSLATSSMYGTIVFYKGPGFDTISSFVPGTAYYYKFYSLTSDGEEAHSAIASYIPGGTQPSNPTVNVQPAEYIIHSAWDDNMCLDISGNSTEVNANIQLYHRVYDDVQKFSVIRADDQYYYVKSVYNGLWLDAKTPLGNNSNVKLFDTNTGTENYWFFEDAGNGYVFIRNKSGYYLDIQGDNAVDNANIQLYEFAGNNSQKWRLEEAVDNWVVLAESSLTFKFNGADTMVAREEPFDAANQKKSYNLGDTVKINQIVRNKYNNIWYRTEDGYYVFDGALDYAEDSGEVVSTEGVDLYLRVKTHESQPMYENRVPFGCWINPVQHTAGDTVHVVKRIHNSVGSIWYLTDGGKYMWQGVLDEDTDLQPPEVTSGRVTQCSTSMFSVTCSFADNQRLKNIQLGIWNDVAGIDNAVWQSIDVTGKNVTYTFTIDLSEFGNQVNTVYHANAFAFDINGNRSEAFRAADIFIETEKPTVTVARIENLNASTYEVVCKATDNGTVYKLRIGTWHDEMSIDDAVWQETEAFTNEARFYVSADYFGGATNVTYHTNVFAIDMCGNVSTAVRAGDVFLKTAEEIPDSWTYEISDSGVLVLDGTGRTADYTSAEELPWYQELNTINRVVIQKGITYIGEHLLDGLGNAARKVRVDFCQVRKPEVSANAFGSSEVVCRYYSGNNSWDGSTGWIYLPYYSEQGSVPDIYFDGRWYIMPEGTDGYYKVYVTGGQALEYAYEEKSLHFESIPEEQEDLAVLQGWDGVYMITFHPEVSGTMVINLPQNSILRYIDMQASDLKVTIQDPREEGLTGRLSVSHGTLNYSGNVEELLLNQSYGNQGHVTIDGDIGTLSYYGQGANQVYEGDLSVTGYIHSGVIYGASSLNIPGIGENITFEGMSNYTFTDLHQDTPIILNSELNLDEENQKKLNATGITNLDQCDLWYQFLDSRVYFELNPIEASGPAYSATIENIYSYNPNFTTADIIYGDHTNVVIGSLDVTGQTFTINGSTDESGRKAGLAQLMAGPGSRIVLNCPVDRVTVVHNPNQAGTAEVQINDQVDFCEINVASNTESTISLGESGRIENGSWNRTIYGTRIFSNVTGACDLFSGGRLNVMSWKEGQQIKALLPSDSVVSEAAGETATVELNESSMEDLSADESSALNAYLSGQGTDTPAAVFDVSVMSMSLDQAGNAVAGESITELSNEIPLTVSNEAGGMAYIIRLHENENGEMTAEPVTAEPSEADELVFASSLFSKYVIVSKGDGFSPEEVWKLPAGTVRIESEAFAGIGNGLKAMDIPATVSFIAEDAFQDTGLIAVYAHNQYVREWAAEHGIKVLEE